MPLFMPLSDILFISILKSEKHINPKYIWYFPLTYKIRKKIARKKWKFIFNSEALAINHL